MTQAAKNTIVNPSIQHNNTLDAWVTTIHWRLAIQTQPWDKQRWRNTRYVHNHQCDGVMHGHMRLHNGRRDMRGNLRWQTTRDSVRSCTLQPAINNSLDTEETVAVLVTQTWDHNYRLNCHKRLNNSRTCIITGKALKQLHLNHTGTEKTRLLACVSAHLLGQYKHLHGSNS